MEDPNVVHIRTREPICTVPNGEAHPAIVAYLEGLLDKARVGQVDGFAIAYCSPGDVTVTCWNDGFDGSKGFSLMGAVSVLHHRMLREASPDD